MLTKALRAAGDAAERRGWRLLIADEPTAQLDSQRARTVMGVLRKLVDEHEVAVIVATHDPILVGMSDQAVELRDGARID